MRPFLIFACLVLAMVNVLIWSAVAGNINRHNAAQYNRVDTQNAAFHPKPVWI